MTQFVSQTLPELIGQLSPLAYLLVFLGGVLTSLGPCNLSMVPVIIGYVAGQEEVSRRRSFWLASAFALGSALTFMGLGLIAAELGMLAGRESRLLNYFAAAVCFVLGLNLLEVIKLNFGFLARLQPKRVALTGLLGAVLLGMAIGLGGSQCGTPVLFAILGVTAAKGQLAHGALLLLAMGWGAACRWCWPAPSPGC